MWSAVPPHEGRYISVSMLLPGCLVYACVLLDSSKVISSRLAGVDIADSCFTMLCAWVVLASALPRYGNFRPVFELLHTRVYMCIFPRDTVKRLFQVQADLFKAAPTNPAISIFLRNGLSAGYFILVRLFSIHSPAPTALFQNKWSKCV